MTVNMAKKILLIGVLPPVLAFSLLLPYPPNAGTARKHAPTRLAAPNATSSRFALSWTPSIPSFTSPPARLFAATEDSKKPSKAIRKEVPIASRICDI